MLGKRIALLPVLTLGLLLVGGCGNTEANLGRTSGYWDGYNSRNNTTYGTGAYGTGVYGAGTDTTGNTVGQDLEDTWDDLTGQTKTANHKTANKIAD